MKYVDSVIFIALLQNYLSFDSFRAISYPYKYKYELYE